MDVPDCGKIVQEIRSLRLRNWSVIWPDFPLGLIRFCNWSGEKVLFTPEAIMVCNWGGKMVLFPLGVIRFRN